MKLKLNCVVLLAVVVFVGCRAELDLPTEPSISDVDEEDNITNTTSTTTITMPPPTTNITKVSTTESPVHSNDTQIVTNIPILLTTTFKVANISRDESHKEPQEIPKKLSEERIFWKETKNGTVKCTCSRVRSNVTTTESPPPTTTTTTTEVPSTITTTTITTTTSFTTEIITTSQKPSPPPENENLGGNSEFFSYNRGGVHKDVINFHSNHPGHMHVESHNDGGYYAQTMNFGRKKRYLI